MTEQRSTARSEMLERDARIEALHGQVAIVTALVVWLAITDIIAIVWLLI